MSKEYHSFQRDMFVPYLDGEPVEFTHIEKGEMPQDEEVLEMAFQYKPVLDTVPVDPEIEQVEDGYIPFKMMLPFSNKNKELAQNLLDKILAGKLHFELWEEA